MSNLINKVIGGIIKDQFTVTRNGSYNVTEYIGASHGKRNDPSGYWEHIWETGGFESHHSFYGKDGEPFESPEEAAKAIISRHGIVGVDANNRAIFKRVKRG